jgi:hypothetical protein
MREAGRVRDHARHLARQEAQGLTLSAELSFKHIRQLACERGQTVLCALVGAVT